MTRYEKGFLTKCAENNVPYEKAVGLLKKAQSPFLTAASTANSLLSAGQKGYNAISGLRTEGAGGGLRAIADIGNGAKDVGGSLLGGAGAAGKALGTGASFGALMHAPAGAAFAAAPVATAGAAVGAFAGGAAIGHGLRKIPVGNGNTVGSKIDDAGSNLGERFGRWWYGDANTGSKGVGRWMPWNRGDHSFIGWQDTERKPQPQPQPQAYQQVRYLGR